MTHRRRRLRSGRMGEIDQIVIVGPVVVREVEPMVPDTLCEAARTKMPENYWLTRIWLTYCEGLSM